MTKLKICGLRDVENALVAADAGADFLGFAFVPGVRRQLLVDDARAIIDELRRRCDGDSPRVVGLFADQPVDDVNGTIDACGLDMVQLCGQESRDYMRQVRAPVIKAIKVRDDDGLDEAAARTLRHADAVVADGHHVQLDKYEAGAQGGTGRSFDWRVAARVAERHHILLAGGLDPDNVRQAIDVVSPWGVDVSSGVETDGVKDPAKIRAFAAAVKAAG